MNNTEVKRLTTSSLNFFANLTAAYESATIHLKHKIVGSIFPELIKFDGEKCRTPKINSVLQLFSSFNEGLREKGQLTQFCQLSPSAERGGQLSNPFYEDLKALDEVYQEITELEIN